MVNNWFYSHKQPNQPADQKPESKTPPLTTPTATPGPESSAADTKPSLSTDVKEKLESKDEKVSYF